MSTKESVLVGKITKAITDKYPRSWVVKIVGNPYQVTGIPDILVCVDGTLVGLEVKRQKPGESEEAARQRCSTQQAFHIQKIEAAGGVADVVLSVEDAIATIERALDCKRST